MIYRFVRDSFFGRLAYHLSQHKLFSYPEEQPDYIVPEKYLAETLIKPIASPRNANNNNNSNDKKEKTVDPEGFDKEEVEQAQSSDASAASDETKTGDDNILTTWDGDDDPENPQNWPVYQKALLIFQISFLTTSVYIGSSIYTPGIDQIMEEFHIGPTVATLPLTLFVLGYAIGPLLFSPFSENAAFGRTSIYIPTLFLFVILQIPIALVDNFAGLCVLRFLSGFFASPCLATGGASVSEVLKPAYIPVGLACWSLGCVCGPSFGPFFGALLTVKASWRWIFWFMCILSGFSFIMLFFSLPETYGKTLLYRKAKRLRAITGNERITSEGELENKAITTHEIVKDTLWRPIEIFLMEPVILMINIYLALVYSIFYLFFEVYPIFFVGARHFTLIELGCTYFSTVIGIGISAVIYIKIIRKIFTQRILDGKGVEPEVFMPLAIAGGICMPVGLFIFGWSATTHTHWIGPLIGAAIFSAGGFLIFQTLYSFLAGSFQYVGSIFAGNNLFRSSVAGCFPLFGRPLYNNLATKEFPVGWGSSVLGFITSAMVAIPVLFYLNGPKLRARSKYALGS
ncbi:MDR1 [[Candida] subhashii]|uniref:MDR1 n=1 Tax=[Candida] subhashii TaxID=561895 RepID=A0A8J5UV71_9ASCO|nr:MDR1 [[Candida] subhashii]KAG7666332.1 MDR1 [[Candida] subhashii]